MTTLKKLLNSPYHQRTVVASYLFLTNEFIYFCYMIYFSYRPSPFLNVAVVQNRAILHAVLMLISALVAKYFHKLKSSLTLHNVLPYFLLNFYVLTLIYHGYTVGHFSLPAGFFFGSFPIVGLMMYKRPVVYSATIFAILLYALATLLCVLKIVPYAPLWSPNIFESAAGRAFYFKSATYWVVPCVLFVFTASDLLVQIWRKRESIIQQLSMTDSLVNIGNRRFIVDFLKRTLMHGERKSEPFSVILLDIDHFKAINDNYGHPTGDKVLKSVSKTILKKLRSDDQLGRYGGEEFLIVLPHTILEEALHIAERCRSAIEAIRLTASQSKKLVPIRASFGVYTCQDSHNTVDDVIRMVDQQLYRAKNKGRNNVAWENKSDDIETHQTTTSIANDAPPH